MGLTTCALPVKGTRKVNFQGVFSEYALLYNSIGVAQSHLTWLCRQVVMH